MGGTGEDVTYSDFSKRKDSFMKTNMTGDINTMRF